MRRPRLLLLLPRRPATRQLRQPLPPPRRPRQRLQLRPRPTTQLLRRQQQLPLQISSQLARSDIALLKSQAPSLYRLKEKGPDSWFEQISLEKGLTGW